MMKYAFLLFFLSGCGYKILSIEPQYLKYIKEFENQSSTTNNKMVIDDLVVRTSETLGDSILAQCRTYSMLTPMIVVSKKFWVQMTEDEREMVMFHELGHCVLGRGHKDSFREPYIPESIMYPYIFSPSVYLFFKRDYIVELFEGKS